jgi:hypothetical protein
MTIDPALKRIRDLLPARPSGMPYQNINQLHDDSMTLGQKVADGVAQTWARGASSSSNRHSC